MKHIKKFNEELNSSTYQSAASKLDAIRSNNVFLGNIIDTRTRANNLRNHSKDMEFKKSFEESIFLSEKYSKYGEFDIYVLDGKGKFNIYMELMLESTISDYEDNPTTLNIGFMVNLIPSIKNDKIDKENAKKLAKQLSDTIGINYDEGYFHLGWLDVKYRLEDSGSKFDKISLYSESTNQRFNFENRKSSFLFKKLICNFFEPTFDYPSNVNEDKSMYENIETDLIQNLDIESDYGLDMGKIKEDLKKLSTVNFYATS